MTAQLAQHLATMDGMVAQVLDAEWDGAGPASVGKELEAARRIHEAVQRLLKVGKKP